MEKELLKTHCTTKRPMIFNVHHVNGMASFHLKKVSRKRYVKLIMALGVPAREAQLMAKLIHAEGLSYKEGLILTMRAIFDVTENTLFKFWIWIWQIQGLK